MDGLARQFLYQCLERGRLCSLGYSVTHAFSTVSLVVACSASRLVEDDGTSLLADATCCGGAQASKRDTFVRLTPTMKMLCDNVTFSAGLMRVGLSCRTIQIQCARGLK